LPPAPLLISSPYDPEARWSKKRDTEWVGYKVHVTETCDEEDLHLVCSAFESGLMPTFDALPSVQHPLAQEGETRTSEHLAFVFANVKGNQIGR